MDNGLLYQRAPEFAKGQWLNREHPLALRDLRGWAVLVDIWDYSCVNCLRTLPYLREWHRRYAALGLTIIGVHTPEFTFGRERQQIELALQELGITYPVLLDNDFQTWNAFDNHFWPAKYLIDHDGYIRCQVEGEGHYETLEHTIQTVLRERNPDLDLPPILPPLREEDHPAAVCHRPTPPLRGGFQRGALGNPEGYAAELTLFYRLPDERSSGAFYADGAWRAGSECFAYQGYNEGIITLPYMAAEVNAVLTPHFDTVERYLNPDPVSVEIWQDDQPINGERRGSDTTDDGRVIVDRPRVYNLVRNPGFEQHELTLRVHAPGFALYVFSFVGGVKHYAGD